MIGRFVLLAWKNVRTHFRHHLATACAIAFGFAAISLFDGFLKEVEFRNVDGFTRRGMLGDIVIQKEGAAESLDEDPWGFALTREDQEAVDQYLEKHAPQAVRVRFLNASGAINAGTQSAIFVGFGYDIDNGRKIRGEDWAWNTVAGVPIPDTATNQIVVGSGLARILGCALGEQDKVSTPLGNYYARERPFRCPTTALTLSSSTENSQVNTVDVNVVGAIDGGFREVNKRVLHMPLAVVQKLMDTDKVMTITAWLKISKAEAKTFALKMSNDLKDRKIRATYWNDHKLASFVRNVQGILNVFRNLFMTIVFVISMMSVANTSIKAVNERVREIGMLRSFGFSRKEVMFLFGFEGLFIAAISCAIGLLLAIICGALLNSLGLSYHAGLLSMPVPLRVLPAPSVWFFTALALSVLSLGTSLLAARRACYRTVAESLRFV